MEDLEKAPNPVDVHVGRRIRDRRKEARISQEKLAEHLGLTFQQVQKYEKGANRVSASKLYEIASALNASIEYFFRGTCRSNRLAGRRRGRVGAILGRIRRLRRRTGADP